MQKKLVRNNLSSALHTVLLILLLSVQMLFAFSFANSDVPVMQPNSEHPTVAHRVSKYLTNNHYKQITLDGSFSSKVFDRYLKLLDPSKIFLTREDINQFREHQSDFVFDLISGKLDYPFEIYNHLLKKRYQRYQYALTLLDEPMNFDNHDEINYQRDDIDWANSEEELDAYWKLRVKADQINLSLLDKSDDEVKESLAKRYNRVLKVTSQAKAEDGFQVMMNAFALEIDPHTNYLSPKEKKEFDSEMSLTFEGIGATLTQEDDYTKIVSFVKGGPAEKSKLLVEGDRIIGIGQQDGEIEDVVGWRLDDVVDLIKGPKGSTVRLQILPEDNSNIKIIEIVRDKIHFEDREAKLTIKETDRGHVAVIDIPSFYNGVSKNVEDILQEIQKDPDIEGVVIDLRNNGGGSLNEVIFLAGLFIDYGPVVQVKDNYSRAKPYGADFNYAKKTFTAPLIVLVNRFSASASEIFAAAMQDYQRAIIVGETTYGKGTVQLSHDLSEKRDNPNWSLGGIKYTIEKFYRINGGSTQLKGVEPDIQMIDVNYTEETGERFLDNALAWDKIASAQYIPVDNFKNIIPTLIEKHKKRVSSDPEFQYVIEDVIEYNRKRDTAYTISLNKSEREKQQKEREAKKLARINERFKREGKPTIESIDDLPKDYKYPDPFLDESVNILLDWVNNK